MLNIGKIKYDNKPYIQVTCDKFDIRYSRLYSIENIDFAICMFLGLYTKYLASELRETI